LGSPELVGRYTIALAVTAPVFMLTNLNLATVLAADATWHNSFSEYLALRIVSTAFAALPVTLAILTGGHTAEVMMVIALVALAKAFESISDVVHGLLQRSERMDIVAVSLAIKGGISLVALAVTQYVTGDLRMSLAAVAGTWAVVLGFYDLPRARRWGRTTPLFAWRKLLPLAWLALPLGLVAALNSLSTQIPRFWMEHSRGERELGVFSAIAALAVVVRLVALALSRSVLPRLAQQFASGEHQQLRALLAKLVAIGLAVGVAGVIGALAFGEWFLTAAYAQEYATHTDVLMVVMLAAGLLAASTFFGTAVTAANRFAIQAAVHIAKVTLIGAVCFALVPRFGALGAAWSLVAGALFSSSAYLVVLSRLMRKARVTVTEPLASEAGE
jgi:O-antigen/teichoic acid export membrane protein